MIRFLFVALLWSGCAAGWTYQDNDIPILFRGKAKTQCVVDFEGPALVITCPGECK